MSCTTYSALEKGTTMRLAALLCCLAFASLALPAAALATGLPADDLGETRTVPVKAAAPRQAPVHHDGAVPGRLLATTDSDHSAAGLAAGRSWSRRTATVPALRRASVAAVHGRTAVVEVPHGSEAAAAEALTALPGVVAVEPDRRHRWTDHKHPNDPEYVNGSQWAHGLADAVGAWHWTTGTPQAGPGAVRVAVLDSGVLGTHPDLQPNLVHQAQARGGQVSPVVLGSDNDPCQVGHGTMVAGVVGAVGNNGVGVVGVAWQIGIVDVSLAHPGDGTCHGPRDSDVIAALDYVTFGLPGGPVDVVNMSFGAPTGACPTAVQDAVDRARGAGITVVAAAGNSGEDGLLGETPDYPAACNGVVGVGAVGPAGQRAPYSTMSRWLDLAAPGGDTAGKVLTTGAVWNGQGTATPVFLGVQGTSFAAPYAAGVAALVHSARSQHGGFGRLGPDGVESLLERSTGRPTRDHLLGWGVVDAGAAVTWAVDPNRQPIPPPEPDPVFPVGSLPLLMRVSARTGATAAVEQAVAVSRAVFPPHAAAHVVLARADDYPDGLAGASLGYGVGPLLFSPSMGPLAAATRAELQRVLPAGGRVYLLGGAAALPAGLEDELRALGYTPVRLAGRAREETAANVARETVRRVRELGNEPPRAVLLATRGNWPDAVAAGSLGSAFGIPVVLTMPDQLHSATAAVLRELQPTTLYVVGGRAVVSDAAAESARRESGATNVIRLSGGARDGTAVAVAMEMERSLNALGSSPPLAVAVNLRRGDGFAHTLSASALSGAVFAVFLPVEGEQGEILTRDGEAYACGLGADLVMAGDRDLLVDTVADRLQALLGSSACP